MKSITRIERHLYERPNHTVREVYRIFREGDPFCYTEKYFSELTKREREALKTVKKDVFHF